MILFDKSAEPPASMKEIKMPSFSELTLFKVKELINTWIVALFTPDNIKTEAIFSTRQ